MSWWVIFIFIIIFSKEKWRNKIGSSNFIEPYWSSYACLWQNKLRIDWGFSLKTLTQEV